MKERAKAWPQGRSYRPQPAELSCKLWAPKVRRGALDSRQEAGLLAQYLIFLLESWAGNWDGARVTKHWGRWGSNTSLDSTQPNTSFLLILKIFSCKMPFWNCKPYSSSFYQVFSLFPFAEKGIAVDARGKSAFCGSGQASRVTHFQ